MSNFLHAVQPEFRGPRKSDGVAAVEFVVFAPILVLLLLAIVELGRAFLQYDTLSYYVRNSARFVSENAIDGTHQVNITDAVKTQATNLTVYGTIAAVGTPVLEGFAPEHVSVAADGDNIEVVANYPYQPLFGGALPLLGNPRSTMFTMRISVTMPAIS